MADNVIIDLMSGGSTVATDNIGDVQHQLIKMEFGPDGAGTQVSETNPLPIKAYGGTINAGTVAISTPGTITSGSIAVTAGTIGTVGAIAQVHNAGTIAGGTIGILTDGTVRVAAGTVAVNTPGTITSGSIAVTAGTVTIGDIAGGTIDKVSEITNGSIVVTNGTVKVVTPGTITSGSIAVTAGTIASVGTVPGIGVVTNITNGTIQNSGTVTGVGVISALTSGTVAVSAGTGIITAGTINSGTINAGTIRNDGRPARNILSFGTTVTLAGTAYGTIIGSAVVGAGTSIWVNDISLVNSGVGTSTFGMGFGTWMAGSAVLVKGKFAPGSGIQKSFPMAVNCGMTNYDLNVFTANAAGTVDVNVSYFISA